MSWIVNLNSGAPLDVAAQNMLYNNGTADVVGPFNLKAGNVQFLGGTSGTYFDTASYTQVQDPQCASVTTQQGLRDACTLNAIAAVTTGQILFQTPLPGTRGTLGQRAVYGPGRWRFDASIGKSFKIRESTSVQIRVDATNVLNHPEPNSPNLNINNLSFGRITTATGNRRFVTSLRLNF